MKKYGLMALTIVVGYIIYYSLPDFGYIGSLCPIYGFVYVIMVAVAFFGIYLYDRFILKLKWNDIYMGKPHLRLEWIIFGIVMPIAIVLFYCAFIPGEFIIEFGGFDDSMIINCTVIAIQ